MGFDLVFEESSDNLEQSGGARGAAKAVGDHVLFANTPPDCKVYVFYYPGTMQSRDAEEALRRLGEIAGLNLFVNLGQLDDPQYDWIASRFQIRNLPVVIITGAASLASAEGESVTAYVRLDDKKLLSSGEKTGECVQELYNLFIRGEVAQAVSLAKGMRRAEMIRSIGDFLTRALKPVGTYLAGLEISYSLIEGKLTLKSQGRGTA